MMDLWGGTPGSYTGLDRFGRVVDLPWAAYGVGVDRVHLQYGYDRNSNRLWRQNDVAAGLGSPQDQLYAYDPLNRLTDAQTGVLNAGHTAMTAITFEQQWGLNAVGDWDTFDQDSSGAGAFDLEQTRDHNKVNEITAIENNPAQFPWPQPKYDAAGNTIRMPQSLDPPRSFTAVYDAWNRLVKLSDGCTTLAQYQYDGLNRRTVTISYADDACCSVAETRYDFYTSSWQLLEQRIDNRTTPDRQFIWGIRYIDDLVLRDRDTSGGGTLDERRYAMQDANFNVSAIADTSGGVTERYEYDAYGNLFVYDVDYNPLALSASDWEITYAGYRYNDRSGLYLVRNRIYHPTLGRWLQRDPLEYVDGMSMYAGYFGMYNSRDPLGTASHDKNDTASLVNYCRASDPTGSPIVKKVVWDVVWHPFFEGSPLGWWYQEYREVDYEVEVNVLWTVPIFGPSGEDSEITTGVMTYYTEPNREIIDSMRGFSGTWNPSGAKINCRKQIECKTTCTVGCNEINPNGSSRTIWEQSEEKTWKPSGPLRWAYGHLVWDALAGIPRCELQPALKYQLRDICPKSEALKACGCSSGGGASGTWPDTGGGASGTWPDTGGGATGTW